MCNRMKQMREKKGINSGDYGKQIRGYAANTK